MRSLANKETALGLRSGSLASNGETSARACSPRMWVSRRIEEFLSAKRAAAIRTRVADKGFEADRYSCEFAVHTWPRVCRISRTRSSTLRPISICAAGTNRRTPTSIATGHRPMATRASVLNNALGRCISNLFPRSCHASLGPAYLSDGHSQYPYLLVQLRSCAKRAFGSFAGYLQLLLTATWRRICVEFRSRQRALRTTAATAGGGAGVSS